MSEKTSKLQVLNRDMIKYIAIIPMFIGHFVGYVSGENINDEPIIINLLMRLALIAPPIFFSFIADGYKYTRSRKKYALRLFIFACITQIPFMLANKMKFTEEPHYYNIFFTLFLGLMAIIVWESKWKLPLRIGAVILIDALTVAFYTEWMIFGVLIILGYHIFREKPKIRFIWFTVLILIWSAVQFIAGGVSLPYALCMIFFTELSFFIVTMCCNGKKGSHPTFSKWFFYIFYPAHLLVIWGAQLLIG